MLIFYKCLRLNNGGMYLFQARDDDEMSQWVSAINQAAGGEGPSGGARSQTLPTGASGGEGKKEKKPFFTLKGKK